MIFIPTENQINIWAIYNAQIAQINIVSNLKSKPLTIEDFIYFYSLDARYLVELKDDEVNRIFPIKRP